MRIKVERKIASNETMSVRKVKGKGSTCVIPGNTLKRIQPPNQTTCTHTNVILPQNFAIFSATRSVAVRCSLAASSSLVTVSTFCSVNCSADEPAGRFPLALTDDVSFFMKPARAPSDGRAEMYCLSFILVDPHSNESVRASICSHAVTKQVRCLMVIVGPGQCSNLC